MGSLNSSQGLSAERCKSGLIGFPGKEVGAQAPRGFESHSLRWLTPIKNPRFLVGFLFGGGDRDRTGDLIVANDALSQLSYTPSNPPEIEVIIQSAGNSRGPAGGERGIRTLEELSPLLPFQGSRLNRSRTSPKFMRLRASQEGSAGRPSPDPQDPRAS